MARMVINGDARNIPLADGSMHCIVTSPPYYGLRDYQVLGQIGNEETVEAYVNNLRDSAREWRRVLRDDGVLWLNLGDSYAGSGRGAMGDGSPSDRTGTMQGKNKGTSTGRFIKPAQEPGIKGKDLYGVPWTVALALRADGWYLRRDIIWSKVNPMPESVTDRPTTAHEYVFLLTKSASYYYDAEAIKEPAASGILFGGSGPGGYDASRKDNGRRDLSEITTRNARSVWSAEEDEYLQFLQWKAERAGALRDVWPIPSQPYAGAHFATMPPELARRCILAGTSARGCCPKCGAPYEREVERERLRRDELPKGDARYRPNRYAGAYEDINGKGDAGYTEVKTLGWSASCECNAGEPVGCLVMDPFSGSGTTGKVALENGRRYVGIELNREYIEQSEARLTTTIGMAF